MNTPPLTLLDPRFDRQVSLREAYRIMEKCLLAYLGRGDMPLSDLVHAFVMETRDGATTDPAAPADFLEAADSVAGHQPQ